MLNSPNSTLAFEDRAINSIQAALEAINDAKSSNPSREVYIRIRAAKSNLCGYRSQDPIFAFYAALKRRLSVARNMVVLRDQLERARQRVHDYELQLSRLHAELSKLEGGCHD